MAQIKFIYKIFIKLAEVDCSSWLGVLLSIITLIFVIKAYYRWKKEIDYKNISSIKFDLLKALTDLFFTLNLHADNYASSDKTTDNPRNNIDYKEECLFIDNELVKKQRNIDRILISYLYIKPENRQLFYQLKLELNKYRNYVLDLLNYRNFVLENKNIELNNINKKLTIQGKIEISKEQCEKLLQEISTILGVK